MKRVLGLIVFCCAVFIAPARAAEGEVIVKGLVPHQPGRPGGMSSGCGVVVGGTMVISAWHVVNDATAVTVIDQLGRNYPARAWDRVDGRDVVVIWLREPAKGIEGVGLYKGEIKDRQKAVSISYWGRATRDRLQLRMEGYVYPSVPSIPGAVRGLGGPFIPGAMPSLPGMSGSGLFIDGKLAGVCSHGPSNGYGYGACYWAALPGVAFPKPE